MRRGGSECCVQKFGCGCGVCVQVGDGLTLGCLVWIRGLSLLIVVGGVLC